jgi:hypothetical protein
MAASEDRHWWQSPAVTTVGYLVAVVLVFLGITQFAERNATNERFLNSMPFRIWIGLAAVSVGMWLALLSRGLAAIRALEGPWRRRKAWWLSNLGGYVAVVLVCAALLAIGQSAPLGIPVTGWAWLIRVLLAVGAIAVAPWILLVWLAHEQVRNLPEKTERIPCEGEEQASEINSVVADLLDIWKVIQNCALALALGLSPAILNTGALRLALIDSAVIKEEQFPPYAVLTYAAPFAAVVAAAILPLVVGYRRQAFALIDKALGAPESGVPTQAWDEDRQRLEARLNVATGVLRNPITALSLLTPFATAALAAFVPT